MRVINGIMAMAERGKFGFEAGGLIAAAISIGGLIFQAGVQSSKIDGLVERTNKLEVATADTPVRLSKIEQLVQDLHDQAAKK